jgi:hypothetical protein
MKGKRTACEPAAMMAFLKAMTFLLPVFLSRVRILP